MLSSLNGFTVFTNLCFSCSCVNISGPLAFLVVFSFILLYSFFSSMKHQISCISPGGMTISEASMSMPSYKWRRVLLKVSGEALAGDRLQNIDPKVGV